MLETLLGQPYKENIYIGPPEWCDLKDVKMISLSQDISPNSRVLKGLQPFRIPYENANTPRKFLLELSRDSFSQNDS